jgi:hypothetical protein
MFKEEESSKSELLGMGDNVVRFVDKSTGELICHIGHDEDERLVFFSKPVTTSVILTLCEILSKKKMRKALGKGDYKKAQKIAEGY